MRNPISLNVALWILQALLALFFAVASGAPKWLLTPEQMAPNMPIPLSDAFVKFIGTAEILGALGLILPGLTRVRPNLTVLAAACLVALTICAATYQLMANQPANAVFALVIGALATAVAYGRWRPAPLRGANSLLVHHGSVVV
jgi:uncharacterized membrane protein